MSARGTPTMVNTSNPYPKDSLNAALHLQLQQLQQQGYDVSDTELLHAPQPPPPRSVRSITASTAANTNTTNTNNNIEQQQYSISNTSTTGIPISNNNNNMNTTTTAAFASTFATTTVGGPMQQIVSARNKKKREAQLYNAAQLSARFAREPPRDATEVYEAFRQHEIQDTLKNCLSLCKQVFRTKQMLHVDAKVQDENFLELCDHAILLERYKEYELVVVFVFYSILISYLLLVSLLLLLI